MSEKKAKEERKEQRTVNFTYRIDVHFMNMDKTAYMIVSGVPEELPEEMWDSVKYAAQAQFATAIQERKFIEFYDFGKTSKDCQPEFWNMSMVDTIKVLDITKIDN